MSTDAAQQAAANAAHQAAIDAAIDQLTGDAVPAPRGPSDPAKLHTAIDAVAKRRGVNPERLRELLGDAIS